MFSTSLAAQQEAERERRCDQTEQQGESRRHIEYLSVSQPKTNCRQFNQAGVRQRRTVLADQAIASQSDGEKRRLLEQRSQAELKSARHEQFFSAIFSGVESADRGDAPAYERQRRKDNCHRFDIERKYVELWNFLSQFRFLPLGLDDKSPIRQRQHDAEKHCDRANGQQKRLQAELKSAATGESLTGWRHSVVSVAAGIDGASLI